MTTSAYDALILGGGAAGFFGAIACAQAAPGRRVLILERGARVLAKVRVSGGGRCNVTHACFDPKELVRRYPRGGKALLGPFHKFQPRDTVEWFRARGVRLKTEPDGRLFPDTDRSQTVIDALQGAAAAAGVTVRTGAETVSLARNPGGGFRLTLKDGAVLTAARLLLATGSAPQGHAWAKALGHAVEPPVPSLFTFHVTDRRLRGLSGVSVPEAAVSVPGTGLREAGPVLITHWGLSGPAVLRLSAWGARVLHGRGYRCPIEVSWTGRSRPETLERLKEWKAAQARRGVAAHAPFGLPHRLWERLADAAGAPPEGRWADLSNEGLARLAGELAAGAYALRGKSAFKEEFVTCGGVRLDEVDFRTMESRLCPGLHFAGEVLDVDGVTGGFNFQSAWTTGWLAGRAMAGAAG